MQEKIVYLHIGHYKTGTTALQFFCKKHRQHLEEFGVLYPVAGQTIRLRGRDGRPFATGNHGVLALGLLAERFQYDWRHRRLEWPDQYDSELQWKNVKDEIGQSPCSKVIISSEFFIGLGFETFRRRSPDPNLSLEKLRHLLSPHQVRVICYLRRPDRILGSWYNQLVKAGREVKRLHGRAKEFRKTLILDLAGAITPWFDVFGPDNLIVRNYDKLHGGNIMVDFFTIAQIPEMDSLVSSGEPYIRNLRIPNALLELKRIRNALNDSTERTEKFNRAIALLKENWSLPPDSEVDMFSVEDRVFLHRFTINCNRMLRELLGKSESGPFFDNPRSILQSDSNVSTDVQTAQQYARLLELATSLLCEGKNEEEVLGALMKLDAMPHQAVKN